MAATSTSWVVTLKVGASKWATITLPGATAEQAIKRAQRLLGNYPCVEIV